MAYAGARGNTAQEMAAVMRIGLDDEAFHAASNRLAQEIASRNIAPHDTEAGEMSLQLSLVNDVWAEQGYTLEPPFLDLLAVNYGAGVSLLDFRGDTEASRLVINDYIAEQTQQRITDLLTEGSITENTKVVLTNALYFYGSWTNPFEPGNTQDAVFNTLSGDAVTVPTMHQTAAFAYGEGDGYQIIDLPYDGDALSMTIVLPEAGRFEEIRDGLSSEWLEAARAGMSADTTVALSLPRFGFSWGSESLVDALTGLGMVDAFSPALADFSGVSLESKLYISEVLHKAFIGVDEFGTEAAAATAVILSDWGMPGDPVSFTVDRPFLLFIRDVSGLLLFTGQVVDPS